MIRDLPQKAFDFVSRIGADTRDSDDLKIQKSTIVRASVLFVPTGALWGAMYLALGERIAGLIPLGFAAVSLVSVIAFGLTRRYRPFRTSQLVLTLVLPVLLMPTLGGFVNSGAVVLWSLVSPLGALVFDEPRRARYWLLAYLALVVVSGLIQQTVRTEHEAEPQLVVTIFFVMNIGGVSAMTIGLLIYFVNQKNHYLGLLSAERERSEGLLLNILPRETADLLKRKAPVIPELFEQATILFADMVEFTPLSAAMPPAELIGLLNEVFSRFDELVEKYDAEKIKTIGDCYMAAAGVPRGRPDHAKVLVLLALEMQAFVNAQEFRGRRVSLRIGINSGPVVAGVIGRKKFAYDLWGDAVNIASRMESQGSPGSIQITRATYELVKDELECLPLGAIEIKGKGAMETWEVAGKRS